MNPNLLIIALLSLTQLSGCSTIPQEEYPIVDIPSKVRSMVYLQRELLALELTNTVAANQQRHSILLDSYCDLINRRFIPTGSMSVCNGKGDNVTKECFASFHSCVGLCRIKTGGCSDCERNLDICLNKQDRLQSNQNDLQN